MTTAGAWGCPPPPPPPSGCTVSLWLIQETVISDSSFVQKYLIFSPKRQVWMRQIWHFELQEEGEGAVHAAAAATPDHHTARWTQTLRPGHNYSQMHYVQECG